MPTAWSRASGGSTGGRCPDGQRPDREGRVVGPEDGREDPADPGAGTRAAGADGLPGGLGRGPDHRPGPDVPGRAGGREDLLQPGAPLGGRAAGVRAVRAERRRGRLHPGLLRHRDHARGQRLDVPRLAADGRDGDRREGEPRGDGRSPDAHRRVAAAATSSWPATRRASTPPAATSPTCPGNWRGSRPPPRRAPPRAGGDERRSPS